MLKKLKRIIAAAVSSAIVLTSAGCTTGKNTAYALTVDGYKVKAGVYIYYSYTALMEAKNMAAGQDENLDITDNKALEKVKIEGKPFLDFVKDKTTDSCINHVAVIKHFDELGLSLTDEAKEEIDEYVEATWDSSEDMFTGNGISKESIEEIMTSSYKSDEIFKAYYGEGGSENVTDDQLREHYTENNARVRYIDMDLHDAEGNDLDEEGKKELKDMAEDFLKRAKDADDITEMLKKFDEFQEEYDDYVAQQAAEAAGEEVATEEVAHDHDAETTTAPEGEESSETTTTTTISYANEQIVPVVTTEEGTKEEDVTYLPSKTCYDWIYNDAKTGIPEIVEDEDTLYVIVRLDIIERMTEDDLWSEDGVENVRYEMYSDDLQDLLDTWGDEYEVVKNEKAYKRYNPFDIKEE